MRQETAQKVATLLQATSGTLTRYHRPRKRPMMDRAEATSLFSDRPIRATHPNAGKYSLTGALKADAKALGYTRYIVTLAAEAIEAGMPGWAWYYAHPDYSALRNVRNYDNEECDTRAVVRTVRSAQKYVETHVLAAA